MSKILKIIVLALIGQGAVMADQSEDQIEHEDNGPSLLQVSQTPIPPLMKQQPNMDPRVKGGTLRGVGEMILIVLAVVFWSQLKETIWPSLPEKTKAKSGPPPTDEAWRGAMLHEAARLNDTTAINEHAVAGDVDHRDNLDRTPLHTAAALGQREATEQLLAFGANASARDFDDVTPCMMAGKRGHREVVRILLDAGAAVGGSDENLPPVIAQELMARLLK
jgi:ankyrin repeat protein